MRKAIPKTISIYPDDLDYLAKLKINLSSFVRDCVALYRAGTIDLTDARIDEIGTQIERLNKEREDLRGNKEQQQIKRLDAIVAFILGPPLRLDPVKSYISSHRMLGDHIAYDQYPEMSCYTMGEIRKALSIAEKKKKDPAQTDV